MTDQPQSAGFFVPFIPIETLRESPHNTRQHSEEQIGKIVSAVREFGWTAPILADGSGIVAGHGRLQAAKRIYASGEAIRLPDGSALPPGTVPVRDCSGWSEKKKRAYIIADNAIPLGATWNKPALLKELVNLAEMGLDLRITSLPETTLQGLQELQAPPRVNEWDLSDTYEPFWIVIRGPLEKYAVVMAQIRQVADESVVVEGSL